MIRAARFLALLVTTILFLAGWAAAQSRNEPPALPLVNVLVAGHSLVAEVPVTFPERHRGLSGRTRLEPDRAMLFYCRPPQVIKMHMRGMHISLDFLWVASGRVIGVTPDVPPAPQAPRNIYPPGPVDLVLEVPAGWAQAHGVGPGAVVRLSEHPGTPRAGELGYMLSDPVYQTQGSR